MRKASGGRFRHQEYWTHCELGGHPSPQGRLLLKTHRSPFSSRRWHWVDLAQHLAPIWTDLCRCLEQQGDPQSTLDGFADQVTGAFRDWQQCDPVARLRLKPSSGLTASARPDRMRPMRFIWSAPPLRSGRHELLDRTRLHDTESCPEYPSLGGCGVTNEEWLISGSSKNFIESGVIGAAGPH